MKHPVVHGHPVHAILSDGPAALIPLAFFAALWSRLGGRPAGAASFRRLALAGAGAAGVAGWWDWLKMPRDHPAWRGATLHGALNTAALLSVLTAELSPRRRIRALAAAAGLVLGGGWIGGDLVFRHGWRVRPAEELEIVAKSVTPGDLDGARREVDDFERRETYLPPR